MGQDLYHVLYVVEQFRRQSVDLSWILSPYEIKVSFACTMYIHGYLSSTCLPFPCILVGDDNLMPDIHFPVFKL